MPLIEQAVYTCAGAPPAAGYRIVARSAGLTEADAHELVAWCPTHDAIVDPEVESFNFHPLPSGAYCISRTISTGWDCNIHGGHQSLTHCLIVSPELLSHFANNPFALVRAATARRVFDVGGSSPSTLEPISLAGGAAAVAPSLLAELAENPGPAGLAMLVQMARDAVSLALAGSVSPERLMEGLLSCMPPQCRLEFSFSTGLKFSPRRPFRLIAISCDPAEQLWVANHANVNIFDLDHLASRSVSLDGWAQWIQRVMAAGQVPLLAAQLSKRRFDLTLNDLPALGLQLLEELDAQEFYGDTPWANGNGAFDETPPRAHAAHHQFEKTTEAAVPAAFSSAAPSTCLSLDSPEVQGQLEHLDDLVYEAIRGQPLAMQQLRVLWPQLLVQLGDGLLADSREQYLRYAISIWENSVDAAGVRYPETAVQALDVICLLFGESANI